MERVCLIYQPCGLGDIIFLQKIQNIWREKGYKIVPLSYIPPAEIKKEGSIQGKNKVQ